MTPPPSPSHVDAYAPREIAGRVRDLDVTKANLDLPSMLALAIFAGAEFFTGNNLVVMAWASRLVSTRKVLRSWAF